MKSVFNRQYQQNDLDSKIVLALERLSHAFRLLLWEQTKKFNLSPMQTQILVYLFYQPENNTVSAFTQKLNLTKATISDSVASLQSKKFITKKISGQDKRVYNLILTERGKSVAKEIDSWTNIMKKKIVSIDTAPKEEIYNFLLKLIISLEDEGILYQHRICYTCKFFEDKNAGAKSGFYCSLLQKVLGFTDLRIDCPEHISAA